MPCWYDWTFTMTPSELSRLADGDAPSKSSGTGWWKLVEGVAAGARSLSHRVVDGEPRGLEGVDEVDRGLGQIRHAHPVDDQPDPELLLGLVGVAHLVVEVHRVPEPGAPSRLDGDPERDVVAPFLDEKLLDLACGVLGQLHGPKYTQERGPTPGDRRPRPRPHLAARPGRWGRPSTACGPPPTTPPRRVDPGS